MRPLISLPAQHRYQVEKRPSTPSSELRPGGMTRAVFDSTSKRFEYKSSCRTTSVDAYRNVVPSQKEINRRKTHPKPANVDNRSEVVTGMTFARAMGLDKTTHKPVNAERHLFTPPLLDYEPYDWRSHDALRKSKMGFAISKSSRSNDDRFYGTAWRGCASLTPTNLTSNPTSYISPERMPQKTNATTSMKSTARARCSLDSLRLNIVNVPSATSSVSNKLGPGCYEFDDNALPMSTISSSAEESRKKTRKMQLSSFLGTRKNDGTGRYDVFAKANASLKDIEENERIQQQKMMNKNRFDPDGDGEDDAQRFDIYKNVDPRSSNKFLTTIKTDDDFAASMKRWEANGLDERDTLYKRDIMKKLRNTFERNEGQIWQLTADEMEDIEKQSGGISI